MTTFHVPDYPPDDDMWAGESGAPTSLRAVGSTSEEHFEARLKALEAELLDSEALDSIEPLDPIIADLLFRDTLTRVYGASGTFKSFMTLDFAGCVGTGTPGTASRSTRDQ